MTRTTALHLQPEAVTEATHQLDRLADRIETVMRDEAPNLRVAAASRDEVSSRVADNLNAVHAAFVASSDDGVAQLRGIASALRAHTSNVVDAERDFIL